MVTAVADDLHIRGKVTIGGESLSWSAARASGPGGQNVNKVSSKVDLRFDLRGTTALNGAQKKRVRNQPGVRLDSEGRVIIVSQATRDQKMNLEDARERLRALILASLDPPKRRKKTKPTRASKRRRVDAKRRRSKLKKTRGRVRTDE
jgi:ribosome-associated protein